MEENKSNDCTPEPCDDVRLNGKGKSSEKMATDGKEETLEKSNKKVKRTWREGQEEDQFRGLLKERDDILAIPVADRSKQLMNRYRDACEKIKRFKWRFPDINSKRLTKAALKKKADDKARLSTDEAKAAARARKATAEAKAKTKERMALEENKAKNRKRMASEENKAKTRERMATQKNKDKTRERMATESNKVADKKRKVAITLANQLVEFRPQLPELKTAGAWEGYGGTNYCRSIRPTCIPGEPLELRLSVKCFPAPVYIWKKDGKVIGREVSGGSLLQRTKQVGEDVRGETRPDLTKKYK